MQKSEFSFEMKRVLIFFFCYPGICLGQIQFDFEKHTLNTWDQSRPESWDTTSQNPLAGNASLIHSFDNPESGHDQVCFSLDSLDLSAGPAEWQFMVQHLYNPSSANNWCVYLLSDKDAMNMHPAGQANGYVVGINFLGSDDLLKIWKIKNRNISVVAGTEVNWQDDITIHSAARIRVTRTVQGDWELFIDHPGFESGWTAVGTGHDDELTDMRYCGIYYEYSSKQDRKLLLDDILINGDFYRDTIPPGFKWVELKDSNMLHVQFSENLDTIPSKDLMNFIVDQDIGNPQEINIIAPDEYMLTFSQGFPDGITCILEIRNIRDMKGNTSDTLRHEFVYYIPKKYDIVINEIMTDPSPPMGLPEYEFVELLNRSHYKIHLMDWTMSCGKTTRVFPSVTIQPDSMLLVIHKDATGMFKTFGKSCPVFTSKAQLSNAGSLIVLEDAHGNIIDWLDYTVDWHANDYFGRGGWSLERIDPDRFCGGIENWKTSADPAGGSPGHVNSVFRKNTDTVYPFVSNYEIPDRNRITLFFSEGMDSVSLGQLESYTVSGEIGHPVAVYYDSPAYHSIELKFEADFSPDSIYILDLSVNLCDCNGNNLMNEKPIRFATPVFPAPGKIVISEILFNPPPGGVDFIEIVNISNQTFDMYDLVIGSRDEYSNQISTFEKIWDGHRLFFPGEYLVLTENTMMLMNQYPSPVQGTWIEMNNLPSFGDNEGTVVLLDRWLQVLEEFRYSSEMHFSLLASQEGVSLERISNIVSADDPGNWHSASENCGFATPGYKNSQSYFFDNNFSEIQIVPEIITPDGDGNNDIAHIYYSFNQPGNVVSILVFEPRGRQVTQIASNYLVGTQGSFKWDGTDDSGNRVRMGIYLVYFRIFHLNGQIQHIKKTCVVSQRRKE